MNGTNWYHGALSREQAENVLREDGFAEGLFLVRESNTVFHDYVLSVVHSNEIIHYQIRKFGEDALFSIDPDFAENRVIHGLDMLIQFYREEKDTGLQHLLGSYVPGEYPPPETRLHGTDNLLHRATVECDLKVVKELLKCGYRNINARNEDGQTAIHLASYYGYEDCIKLLIKAGAHVNVRDRSGYAPLHYACQSDKPSVVHILLRFGNANPQFRNNVTEWVPLHEAAMKGHAECVAELLRNNAPVNPRTPKKETPADLARQYANFDCLSLLCNYEPPQPNMHLSDFFHPNASRESTVNLLREHGNIDGSYLVRKSSKKRGVFVLSMMYNNQCSNFLIVRRGIYFYIDSGPYLGSLEHVVAHYSTYADGLPTLLRVPIKPKMSQSPVSPQKIYNFDLEKFKSSCLPDNHQKTLLDTVTSKDATNANFVPNVAQCRQEIPVEKLSIGEIIGEGEFGSVHRGLYVDGGVEKYVAIKALSVDASDKDLVNDFLREAEVMVRLDHPCIVRLKGICKGPPVLMVQELVSLGSLLDFLLDCPSQISSDTELPLWAAQVACGMEYLEQKKIVHRDLATRNILLDSKYQAKISDFGLSRTLEEKNYYKASKGGRWPVKWYAPESVNYGTFSHLADVWSYGVTLWEMWSYGDQPYGDMTGAETIDWINKGNRLSKPSAASNQVYDIMRKCWSYNAVDRNSFHELFVFFSEEPEYLNIKEMILSNVPKKLNNN